MSKIIGIDLGTSTSEVGIFETGKPIVIGNHLNEKITPSVVGLGEEGQLIIGRDAKDQMLFKPEDTVMEVKRLMGSREKVKMGGKEYRPQEMSSFILKYLKECAEAYLEEEVLRAVITVPAYFTDEQRRATVEAGGLAGLKVERIINEPTAAALAYGIDHMDENQHILVYDLGGGTLDVTVLEMFEGVLEVKASSGNNQLGGKDFDQKLIDYLCDRFFEQYHIDLRSDLRAMAKLKKSAEECKITLSGHEAYHVLIPFIAEKEGNPVSLEETITRQVFESLIEEIVQSTLKPITIALKDAKLTSKDLDLILMVGGSTRVPLVKSVVDHHLGQGSQSLVDPDLAVVTGAAIQAGMINEDLSPETDIVITDVCPYTLGVETMDFIMGMPLEDVYDVIIPRNTTIPVMREKIYTTVSDDQEMVEIIVYQGDYEKASLNNLLGKFELSGIPPAKASTEKIKIRFTYDVNGILQVEGMIVSTGKQAQITIDTTGVEMEQEVDLEGWKKASMAKKYRALIRKGEKFLEEEEVVFVAELEGILKKFKRALILEEGKERLEELEEELLELLYDMEEEE
ncbi:2-alkenal reductase [Alkaliphilus metalliredigens QYMF]|uniref:Chaperone protein DnaK n=1 Tax=Alkaliphilus metalliredigens (strain QYMF) TaxID=293826 RepID=A6TJZ9_ALKMQ|nr:Hsp70 family protein [Alkaliphilus metalliredigens]ABR46517.1 2-alkenal reductase [Alkaliphilus metalliredigens QYMF]